MYINFGLKGVFSMVNMVNQILKAPEGPPSDVEGIKERSNYLRGTLKEVMLEPNQRWNS